MNKELLSGPVLRNIFDSLYDAVIIHDLYGNVLDVNAKMLEMYGVNREIALSFSIQNGYSSPNNPLEKLPYIWEKVIAGEEQLFEWVAQRPLDKTEFDIEVYLKRLTLEHSDAILATVRDISQRKMVEEKLTFASMHDGLTGLYNRGYFQQEMKRIEKSRIFPIGLIICDVDGLKLINDTLGHSAGDKALKTIAQIIQGVFRGGDVVARIGGDEFAVLVPYGDADILTAARDRISDAVSIYNTIYPSLPLSVSVGSSLAEQLPINMTQLFKDADNNMYSEKAQKGVGGRSNIIYALFKTLVNKGLINIEALKQFGLPTEFSNEAQISQIIQGLIAEKGENFG